MIPDPRMRRSAPTPADNLKGAVAFLVVVFLAVLASMTLLGFYWFRVIVSAATGVFFGTIAFGLVQEWCVDTRYWKEKKAQDGSK